MRPHIVRRQVQSQPPVGDSVLAQAAAQLGPGQCIRLPITITAAQCVDDGAPVFKWASSACWAPNAREVLGVYKRQDASHAYKFLTFHEDTNALDMARDPWSTSNQSGHGYDHNTIDPATDRLFHKPFNDEIIRAYLSGAWSNLPTAPGTIDDASSISFVPTIGASGSLLTFDYGEIRRLDMATLAWSVIATLGGVSQNHSVSEYSPTANAVIFGAGNNGDSMSMLNCSTLAVTAIPTPPFNLGSSDSQGVLCAVPGDPGWIGNQKGGAGWCYWKAGDLSWSSLTQSSGSGASAQNGLPNLTSGAGDVGLSRIAAPISTYDVQWWLEYVGGGDVARIWLYGHT